MRIVYRRSDAARWFSAFVPLIPILQYYVSPIGAFNAATFLAVCFLALFILNFIFFSRGRVFLNLNLLPAFVYLFYMTLNVIVTGWYYSYPISWNSCNTYIRLVLLFTALLFFGYGYFDREYALRVLTGLVVVCSVMILVQDVLYYGFSHGINMNIPALLTVPEYSEIKFRFSALYMEPAHFAQSAVLCLFLRIFSEERSRSDLIQNMIILTGVALSGSGQGYLFLGFLYLFWIMYSFAQKRISRNQLFFILFVTFSAVLSILFLLQLDVVRQSFARILGQNGILDSTAFVGRTYTNVFFSEMSADARWLGVGFGHQFDVVNRGLYINSFYSHLIQCGYTGAVLLLFLLLVLFIRGDAGVKAFIPVYALMIYFASGAGVMELCFYFLFLLPAKNERTPQDTVLRTRPEISRRLRSRIPPSNA